MEKQITLNGLAIDIRVVVRRFLLLWFFLLRCWASKWVRPMAVDGPVALTRRKKFKSINLEMQEELRQTFSPVYHLCEKECSSCCQSDEKIPYGAVDGVLYGFSADMVVTKCPIALTEFITQIFLENVFLVRRYLKQVILGKTASAARMANLQMEGPFCPALTETGCTLPWGGRPTFCVFFLCGEFLRAMDWREYWRYVRVSCRYLLLLTLSLNSVVAEWRHKQKMATVPTN
jgi:hypothetical protein